MRNAGVTLKVAEDPKVAGSHHLYGDEPRLTNAGYTAFILTGSSLKAVKSRGEILKRH